MINIWFVFGTTVLSSIGLLIIGIVLFVKKQKFYILSEIIIVIFILVCIISDTPYMKDLAEQETLEVVAEYVGYQKGNVHPGARIVFFENENQEFNLLTPSINGDHIKMEIGKTYKIEFFKNSKVIKKYILVE